MIAVPCGIKNQVDEKFHSARDSGLSGAWYGLLGRDIAGQQDVLEHGRSVGTGEFFAMSLCSNRFGFGFWLDGCLTSLPRIDQRTAFLGVHTQIVGLEVWKSLVDHIFDECLC